MLILDVLGQGLQTAFVPPSHAIVIYNRLPLHVNGGEAPVHAQVHGDQDNGVLENVHLLRPSFDTGMATFFELGVKKRREGENFREVSVGKVALS